MTENENEQFDHWSEYNEKLLDVLEDAIGSFIDEHGDDADADNFVGLATITAPVQMLATIVASMVADQGKDREMLEDLVVSNFKRITNEMLLDQSPGAASTTVN